LTLKCCANFSPNVSPHREGQSLNAGQVSPAPKPREILLVFFLLTSREFALGVLIFDNLVWLPDGSLIARRPDEEGGWIHKESPSKI
jgi:hypothetical protein